MLWAPVLVLFLGVASALDTLHLSDTPEITDDFEEKFQAGLEHLLLTGEKNDALLQSFNDLQSPNPMKLFETGYGNRRLFGSNPLICLGCRALARTLIEYRKHGATRENLIYLAEEACIGIVNLTANVCHGLMELNIDTFLYIIDNKPELAATNVCSILGQPIGCFTDNTQKWNVSINTGPRIYPKQVNNNAASMRILQFTDIHYDDIYQVGGNAECNEPLCCGNNQGPPANEMAKAGAWGDYRSCDMPWHAVLNALDEMKSKTYDLAYFTGDVINHRVWATNKTNNMKVITKLYEQLKITFKDTKLYPILGNHEPNPLDVFAPTEIKEPNLSTQWLFNTVADEWSFWLPQDTQETIRRGGYYSVLVKPGFRVIGLNSNVAYVFNWWLLWNDVDPYGQLQWLSNTLEEAEKKGEIVHILSHVPTADDTCYIPWAREYVKIIDRYHHIIAVQLNGHTHQDEMTLFYSRKNRSEVVNVAYNAGSLTTYTNLNPDYRIYTVNPVNYRVEDYDEYVYNMTEANMNGLDVPPNWYKLYSFKEAWKIHDMTNLLEMDKLVTNIARNDAMYDQYWRFKVREGDASFVSGCDNTCVKNDICRLVTNVYGEDEKCNEILSKQKYAFHWKLI